MGAYPPVIAPVRRRTPPSVNETEVRLLELEHRRRVRVDAPRGQAAPLEAPVQEVDMRRVDEAFDALGVVAVLLPLVDLEVRMLGHAPIELGQQRLFFR